jgi:hypothetical protein
MFKFIRVSKKREQVYKQKIVLLIISLLLFWANPSILFAGAATLSWVAPTSNDNGTCLSDPAGYKIYYGTSSGMYSRSIDVGNVTSYTVSDLTEGVTYYFAATAYDGSGNESDLSNEVSTTISGSEQLAQGHTLTVEKNGGGEGKITSSPSGIYCGNDCAELYNEGSIVTLTASPYTGSLFYRWAGGSCTGNGECVVTINRDETVTAEFIPEEQTEIIIDNRDAAISWIGAWGKSSGTDSWGVDSVFSRDNTSVTPTFTWYFTPSQSGTYAVYMWWTYRDSRSTSVPVDIEYYGGTASFIVDQHQPQNAGTWNVFGTYPFEAGGTYRVTVTAQPIPTSSSTTCADAVRFILDDSPTAYTISATACR